MTALVIALFTVCGRSSTPDPEAPKPEGRAPGEFGTMSFDDGPSFEIDLSEARDLAPDDYERPPAATGRRLAGEEVEDLLSRLPALDEDTAEERAWAIREDAPPAPRTGETIEGAFPPEEELEPPEAVAADADEPLEVLRFSPEGEVPLAPQVSVTFNQPMVEVTSHEALARAEAPLRIDPEPEGEIRWVGTRTLLFEARGERLPMATRYDVDIPEGARSASGRELRDAPSFQFETPPVEVVAAWPDPQPRGRHRHRSRAGRTDFARDQVMFLELNQRVDRDELADYAFVEADGEEREFVWLDREEVEDATDEGDAPRRRLGDGEGRVEDWVAMRPAEPLPHDASISYGLREGAPSAEGPLTTESAQRFSYRTYGPLELVEAQCGRHRPCKPPTPITLDFSNQIDLDEFSDELVEVEPQTPGIDVSARGSTIRVTGHKEGRESYRITISDELRDRYGQSLAEDEQVEFDVGPADPWFASAVDNFVVADPASEPEVSFRTVNHHSVQVDIHRVEPGDWADYRDYLEELRRYRMRREGQRPTPPGEVVESGERAIDSEPDAPVDTRIGLGDYLGDDGLGHLVVAIEPSERGLGRRGHGRLTSWVQSTEIGLDGFSDESGLVAWATSLETGEPLPGVTLSVSDEAESSVSDEAGLARLPLPESADDDTYLRASSDGDVAFLPSTPGRWGGSRVFHPPRRSGDELRWHVLDDRAMYRPGEEVRVKGWLRRVENEPTGDIRLAAEARRVRYEVQDSRGNEIAEGETETTALGGFDLDFEIPETPNLGSASIELRAPGVSGVRSRTRTHSHDFSIEEFRRPEFEVDADLEDPGPHFAGDRVLATASANYYAGGALPGADTSWEVEATPGSFSPPGHEAFSFGLWTPWWRGRGSREAVTAESLEGETDATGEHQVAMDLGAIDPPRTMAVQATATVMDVNRQAWSSESDFLVHPGEDYVGLKTERYFVQRGDPLEVEAIVADIDGEIREGRPIHMTAARVSREFRDGEWSQDLKDTQECAIESAGEPVSCEFDTEAGGRYAITATTTDGEGRASATRISRWVSGGTRPAAQRVEQEDIELIPDRDEYEPGDTAEILISSPFSPAEALVTLRRSGLVRSERIELEGPGESIEIPIEEAHLPNVHVQVDAVGQTPRLGDDGEAREDLPARPAFASGSLDLEVSTEERTLDVEVAPRSGEVAPGASTAVDVRVRDHRGAAVEDAEVAVIVVDEAVLALTGYELRDPIETFYRARSPSVRDLHLRAHVALADVDDIEVPDTEVVDARQEQGAARRAAGAAEPADAPAASAEMVMDDDAEAGEESEPIDLRRDLDPLAAFSPAERTDASGEVTLDVDMPDNLTRYRVMAIAAHGENRFGAAEDAVTARLPLMVRPSLPRFLNYGDEAELPVVVQNQTGEEMRVRVAARAANLDLVEPAGREVEVPARERVEVRFPADAEEAGSAAVQVAAASGEWADAAEESFPVWTPATTEAFATYGEIDDGAAVQPVAAPPDALPDFGELEVTTSSTALQALTDAFLDLYDRDFEQTERIASRVIAIATLRDVLEAFDAEGMPEPGEIEEAMERDIEELAARQARSGGFGLWRAGGRTLPFISVHVAHALARAADKDYEIPEAMLDRSARYLENIERHIPGYYPEEIRRVIVAYSLYARALFGDADPDGVDSLLSRAGGPDELPLVAVGWLYRAALGADTTGAREQITGYLRNRVTETAASAHFADETSLEEGHLILHSSRRADAVILEAMIEDQPESDLAPKLARGLLAHRTRGKWKNSQENSFVLAALDRYFRAYESQTPNFVARAWLGDDFAGEHAFRGRSTERHSVRVPMRHLVEEDGDVPLLVQKRGAGRLYYRIGLSYAPRDLDLEPADHGFAVERTYRGVDDPDDVRRRGDGTWEIRAGARVEVELKMVAPTRRYHVALVDPLPAGLEAQNPRLAVTADVPDEDDDDHGFWWWRRSWYEHQNMRDERVEAFATLVRGGVHDYSYVARATTPGRFIAPPAVAEEMYHPETFGRSGSERVEVLDAEAWDE